MDESLLTFGCEIFCSENSLYFVLIKMTSSILVSDALPIHVNACFLLPLTTKKKLLAIVQEPTLNTFW